MSVSLLITSLLSKLSRIGEVFSKLGIEMFDTTTFKFTVDSDAMTGEKGGDLSGGFLFSNPAFNKLTFREGRANAFEGSEATEKMLLLTDIIVDAHQKS